LSLNDPKIWAERIVELSSEAEYSLLLKDVEEAARRFSTDLSREKWAVAYESLFS